MMSLAVALVMLIPTGSGAISTPPPPAPITLDVAALPSGPPPEATYLSGRTLHLSNGERIRDVVEAKGRLTLLGRGQHGWVVAAEKWDGAVRLFQVRRSGSERFFAYDPSGEEYTSLRLSDDGSRVMWLNYNRGGASAFVMDLNGEHVDHRVSSYFGSVNAFSGPEAIVDFARVTSWAIGGGSTTLATHANFADYQHDVLFSSTDGLAFGPTSLSAPSAPTWTADFRARRISPDGTLVLGIQPDQSAARKRVEIRRLEDGTVLAVYKVPTTSDQTFEWEDDQTVLFEGQTGPAKSALIRCDLSGVCERATDWHSEFSVPFESAGWIEHDFLRLDQPR